MRHVASTSRRPADLSPHRGSIRARRGNDAVRQVTEDTFMTERVQPKWKRTQSAEELAWAYPSRGSAALWQRTPLAPAEAGEQLVGAWDQGPSRPLDEIDRRLMDTFPASDAVARY